MLRQKTVLGISCDNFSAGITIVSALVSMLTKRCLVPYTAMTGEMTLRGLVLPVGGIKEKVLAAHRGGIKRVICSHRNRKDFQDIPSKVMREMEVNYWF